MEKEKVAHSSFWVNFFNSPTEETDLKNSLKVHLQVIMKTNS